MPIGRKYLRGHEDGSKNRRSVLEQAMIDGDRGDSGHILPVAV